MRGPYPWDDRDAGAVPVDDVIPTDPLDPRPRLECPVMVLRCPDKGEFLDRMTSPRMTAKPAEHVVESLYGRVGRDNLERASSSYRYLSKPYAWAVFENNADLEPHKTGVRYLPVPHRPLFKMDSFEMPFRGIDWAAISQKVLDDDVTDPTNRYLAVAAHQGIVVEGFEDRIRKGMLELQTSGRLLARLIAERMPQPPVTGQRRSLRTYAKAAKIAVTDPDEAVVLASPHRWWAIRFVRDSLWNYAPITTPIYSAAMAYGEYDTRLVGGAPVQSRKNARSQDAVDVLDYLQAVALGSMGAGPLAPLAGRGELRLAKWGLVTFRLPDDSALERRVGYCPYVTPRGWSTLWAHGRLLEWLEALKTPQSG